MYVFLSPHFDDAIGSAGGLISRLRGASKPIKIITIMGGIPNTPVDTAYVLARRKENDMACKILGIPYTNGPFLDAIYRTEVNYTIKDSIFNQKAILEQRLCTNIFNYLNTLIQADDIVIAPSALGNHVDHQIVKEAVKHLNRQIVFYEDFFYDTMVNNDHIASIYKTIELTRTETQIKLSAIEQYVSQTEVLFGTKEKMFNYFKQFHTVNNHSVERFSDISVFN